MVVKAHTLPSAIERRRLRVTGVVQGVGFRPFVYGLALDLALAGFVGNDSAGVLIEIEGEVAQLDAFQQRLITEAPPLSFIENVAVEACTPTGAPHFVIAASHVANAQRTFVSPDVALCDACLRELLDPNDRRYRYPFINCTNCGPRFTIIQRLPYDRPYTTMAAFAMCPACRHEYENPLDRRFHAQPIACPVCGPRVEFVWSDGGQWAEERSTAQPSNRPTGELALVAVQTLLAGGRIVAIKGLGGFHLACDATNDGAIRQLRERKGRVDKPFAVMVADVAMARQIAVINDDELALLTSRERPIVLLRHRDESPLSPLVAPGNHMIGLMLPYTPLHHLLFHPTAPANQSLTIDNSFPPLVMTSGNYSNEPIVTTNADALAKLALLADGFLLHNRAIYVPCDDSVVRVSPAVAVPNEPAKINATAAEPKAYRTNELPIRRSRGYAPFPVKLPFVVRPTLAVGGELKNTFSLGAGQAAFMSQHIGDMETLETMHAFAQSVNHFAQLFEIQPELMVCDRHPGYLSSRWAKENVGQTTLVEVQHHHAHLAALMAEHGLDRSASVIGFCFDGTGYGDDGAIWGGEVMVATYAGFERRCHLRYIPLPGGDGAVKHPCRTALAHLWAAGVEWDEALPPVAALTVVERNLLLVQLERSFQTVPTSSMGRLFDAVAALAGVRQQVSYEAQGAIELEALALSVAAPAIHYRFAIDGINNTFDAVPVIQAIVNDLLAGESAAAIGRRFHCAVAELILDLSLLLRQGGYDAPVALSGGVFQNVLLLQETVARLHRAGFQVLTHRLIPPNDGGLALGQLIVANAQWINGQ